ncbi:MAG: WbqC family protein [Maribacter sp.]|nr:WbqC family protein [Maribacter sp.]
MKLLLHPTYFPNIATMACLVRNEIIWEVEDNYQKQTYRNRCYICTDQGKHLLSIPIKHVGGDQGRQKYKDVKLGNEYQWQRQHWRTLQTAYRTSPYFEYYEDDIAILFEKKYDFLLDFNFKTIEVIHDCLQITMPTEKSQSYQVQLPPNIKDARLLVSSKKEQEFEQQTYVQVFGNRHGFIKNTSVLDLLFNEGTNALTYLRDINLKLPNA